MNADASGQTRLTNNTCPCGDYDVDPNWSRIGRNSEPAWSPDSAKIAFSSDRHSNNQIYVMNADGTGQTNLSNNDAHDWGPSWSP